MKRVRAFLVLSLAMMVAAGVNENYKEHLDRVWKFGCRDPQKRSIAVSSLKALPSHDKYFPEVTVLHRCDLGSGRCPQGERYGCGPAETEEVSLVFRVTRIMLPSSEKAKDERPRMRRRDTEIHYETLTFTNHTLCECQLLSDLPK